MYHCEVCEREFENERIDQDNHRFSGNSIIELNECSCGGTIVPGFKNFGAGLNFCSSGDYEHISDSLAINPDQIAEHKEYFPNIDVLPDGRPVFKSVKQQERYLDATGFTKMTQRVRNKNGVTRVHINDL